MTTKYLDLKMDFMFKQLFGDPRRKSITIAFLNDLLNRKENEHITDVQYENTEKVKEEYDGKSSRLDLLVFTSNHERINIEIQVKNHLDLPERILYYWSKIYSTSIGSGDEYDRLVPTIMVTITNFPLFPQDTDQIHNVFKLLEQNEHFQWSSHLEFHILDLSQFMVKWKKHRREIKQSSSSEYPWLMMLAATNFQNKKVNEEMIQELEEFAVKEQEIRKALIEWETLSNNKENKALYEARLKFLRDELAWMRTEKKRAREEGLKEGREEGREQGLQQGLQEGIELSLKKVVKNALIKGMTFSMIAELTGLSEEEVEKLSHLSRLNGQ